MKFNVGFFIRSVCMSGLGGEVPAEAPAVDPLPANPVAVAPPAENLMTLEQARTQIMAELAAEKTKSAEQTTQVQEMARAMLFLKDELPALTDKLGNEFKAHMDKCPVVESDTLGRAQYAQAHILTEMIATLSDEEKAEMPALTQKALAKIGAMKFSDLMNAGELLADGMAIYKEREKGLELAKQEKEKRVVVSQLAQLTPAQRNQLPAHEKSRLEALDRQQALIEKQQKLRLQMKEGK